MKPKHGIGVFLLLSLVGFGYVTQSKLQPVAKDVETRLVLNNQDYGCHQLKFGERKEITLPESDFDTYMTVLCREYSTESFELIASIEQVHRTLSGNYNLYTTPSLTLRRGSEGSIEVGSDNYVEVFWQAKYL